jgi:hypothetical protein
MVVRIAHHETSLVIRLVGLHTPVAEEAGGQVQVIMPGAVITLADARAAHGMFVAWADAATTAGRLGLHNSPRVLFKEPAQRVNAAVLISGKQPKPIILGRQPEESPSGAGQVVVKVGRLTIVCDDKAAYEGQHTVWDQSYEVAATLWEVPDRRTVLAAAESRAEKRRLAGG